MPSNPTKVHLFSGFLGTGKTTLLRHLIANKPVHEKWLLIVNEFGEIGIDGAVLSDNGIPVSEISGGCLCCTAGGQMSETIPKMMSQYHADRILIEASGLAHAAGIIDELENFAQQGLLSISTVFTVVDPRQFTSSDFFTNPLYRDQIQVCDILLASKTDLCTPDTLALFQQEAEKLFPPKTLIASISQGRADIAWLDLPTTEKARYRIKVLPENTRQYQSQGFTFAVENNFDAEKLTAFFNALPTLAQGLVRAKGIFRVMDSWVWLNWTDGQWGATQTSWRRDSRFEIIAEAFDVQRIESELLKAIE